VLGRVATDIPYTDAGGHPLFLPFEPGAPVFPPLSPLSECAKDLYFCISAFAECEKTLCLSVFAPVSVNTDIQILSVS
jgi:hypothetical protein